MFRSIDHSTFYQQRRRYLTGALLIASVFLFVRSYSGIRHDGILYAGDALAYLVKGQLHQDLYFLYGSQGQFTVLPFIYSKLIGTFGLSNGTMLGLFTAFAFFLLASWLLLKAIVPKSLLFYCMLSVVLGWTIYGGRRVFAYSEPFLTARSFAEPAVLLAIAFLARGRIALALMFVGIALVFHPLVGLTGALVVWLFLVLDDRRWLWFAVAAVVLLLAFAFFPIGPFADLMQRYDATWLDLVEEANPQAFILHWTPYDGGIIVFDVAVIWLVARCSHNRLLTRLTIAAAVVGLSSLLVTFVGVDLLHSAFIAKLQVWRTLWIAHWLSMAALPIVLNQQWKGGAHGRLAAILLAIAWMAPFSVAPAPLGLAAVLIDRYRTRFSLSRPTVVAVAVVAAIIAIAIAVQYEVRVFKLANLLNEPTHNLIGQAAAMNLILLCVAIAIWYSSSRARWLGLCLAVFLFISAITIWDQRGVWTKRLESYPVGTNIWPTFIEPNATVYWYRDLIAPWVLLGHGNYYTQQQGSGAVFSREMVFELNKRRKITAILDFQEQICRMMNNLSEKQDACEPDAEAVSTICKAGGIDYVVLQSRLEGRQPTANFSTGLVENGYEKKFFLYRCSALQTG